MCYKCHILNVVFSREPDALVRPRISLQDCLEVFAQSENVEQFYSSAINAKTIAKKFVVFLPMQIF